MVDLPILMPTARILIVDDEPASIALLVHYLSDSPFEIMIALEANDGLRKAAAGLPDLILLDMTMPKFDGLALCRALKADERTARIPVIFLTARDQIEDKLNAFATGAVDYITKPFEEAEVIARISLQLRNVQELRRLQMMAGSQLATAAPQTDREEQLLQSAVTLLTDRIESPPTLAELASLTYSNEQKLTELFKRKVGMSVFDYFTHMRLEASKRLLTDSDMQIQLIAARVGYKNPGDFSRAFVKRYGVGPREFRKIGALQEG